MAQEILLHATQNGKIEEVSLLLERGLVNVNVAAPPSNATALHGACRQGDTSMVDLLLGARANPNVVEAAMCGGRTPLHIAAKGSFVSIACALLRSGAHHTVRDSLGLTPLHVAAQEGCVDLSRVLLAKGADPHIRDNSGHNAAWWAKEYRHPDVFSLFTQMEVEPLNITARERLNHAGIVPGPKKAAKKKAGSDTARKQANRSKSAPSRPSPNPLVQPR